MSEHAFDPMPDEQQDGAIQSIAPGILYGDSIVVDTPLTIDGVTIARTAEPNATVTVKQVRAAVETGRWEHEVPGTALWLNTSFPPHGHTDESLTAVLNAHGVVANWPNPAGAR